GGAVGNHSHRQVGRMGGVIENLHIENSRQAAESLCADTEIVDLAINLKAQFFDPVRWAARNQFLHVDRLHEGLLSEQHGFFRRAANADSEHSRRAPSGAHGGNGFDHPIHDGVRWVQHHELRFRFGTSALGSNGDFDITALHQLQVHHGGSVVSGIAPRTGWVGEDGGAEFVIRIQISAAHTLIDHLLYSHLSVPAHIHADLQENRYDAGVLAYRAMAFGAH